MKQLVSRAGAAIGAVAALAVASPAAAQGPGGPGPRQGVRGGIVSYLAQHPQTLNLDDQQASRLRAVAAWLERSDSSLRGQLRAALAGKRLRDLSAEQRYQLSLQLRPLREQMRVNRYAAVDSLHAVLTADQWQRLGERRMAARAWGRGFQRGFARGRFGFRGGPWRGPRRGASGWGPQAWGPWPG
jgi:plasmid stability protein